RRGVGMARELPQVLGSAVRQGGSRAGKAEGARAGRTQTQATQIGRQDMAYTTQVATVSDTEILISRRFNAPRRLVFECMSKPEYIREWLLGPEGWAMP